MKKKCKLDTEYAPTYTLYLEWFMQGHNIRANPYYRPEDKYSKKLEWWWRDIHFENIYKETCGKDYPHAPYITTCGCESRISWFLKNMVKYNLIVPREPEGYDVTEYGKEVWKEHMEYLKSIGVKIRFGMEI